MSNLELMLKIFGVDFNQAFKVIDVNDKPIGTFVIQLLPTGQFILRSQNEKTNTWLKKTDNMLGSLMISLIKNQCKIKPLKNIIEKEFIPVKHEKAFNAKDYPVYITDVTVNKEDDFYLNVQYINHLGYNKTRILKCYKDKKGNLYCRFGINGHKVYLNYKGPLILVNVPDKDKVMLNKVIAQYGTIMM
jgi:hypothetical protein